MPIITAIDSDMSAKRKLLNFGGPMKREAFPCHCCAIQEQGGNWKCYHHDILSERNVNLLREKLISATDGLYSTLENLEEVIHITKINVREDPRGIVEEAELSNNKSIYFDYTVPNVTKQERQDWSDMIWEELILRELDTDGNIDDRREKL